MSERVHSLLAEYDQGMLIAESYMRIENREVEFITAIYIDRFDDRSRFMYEVSWPGTEQVLIAKMLLEQLTPF